MELFNRPNRSEPAAEPQPLPDGLDRLAQQLWATEPACRPAERHVLLGELADLCRNIERLHYRQQFDPDSAVDRHEIERCHRRLRNLARRWPLDPVVRPELAA